MKNNLFILSLFLMFPFTMQFTHAAVLERDDSVISSETYIVNPRVKSFLAKSIGKVAFTYAATAATGCGFAFVSAFADGLCPNPIFEPLRFYVEKPYLAEAVTCVILAYQLGQAMFGKVDHRPAIVQASDAAVSTVVAPINAVVSWLDSWKKNAEDLSRRHPNREARLGILRTLEFAPKPTFHEGGASQWNKIPLESVKKVRSKTPSRKRK